MVATESVMITAAIKAFEHRCVIALDIPGAFLHAELDVDMIMLQKGELAEMMVMVDPKLYRPYVIVTSKGEKLLYVRMRKAMYGLLQSVLLFYLRVVKDLKEYGFELNPYDPCMANKLMNGTQMTVTWHMDDLKVSHKSAVELTKLL